METVAARKKVARKNTKTAKEKLLALIEEFDESRAGEVYELLYPQTEEDMEGYIGDDTSEAWSPEFVAELDRRWENYKNGGKTYTLAEFVKLMKETHNL